MTNGMRAKLRLRLRWTMAALLLTACGGIERRFGGGPPEGPIAVGATAIGGVGSETCRRGERGSWCDSNHVEILSIATEPAGIFEATKQETGGGITFRALSEGTAKIVIIANDGFETKTFEGTLTALAVNDVSVMPVNQRGEACAEPLLYATDTSVDLPFELRHDATVLKGANSYPFEVTGATINMNQIYERKLGMMMPAVAGTASLTSRSEPTFALAMQVFARSDVQAIQIGAPAKPITQASYNGSSVPIDLEIGGRVACAANMIRTISVSTPEQCVLSNGTTERSPMFKVSSLPSIEIHGLKAGTCTLTVTLDGTAVTATKSFPVGT